MCSASGLLFVMISTASPSAHRGVHVDEVAAHLAGDGGLGETRADRFSDAEDGGPLRNRLGAAVGKVTLMSGMALSLLIDAKPPRFVGGAVRFVDSGAGRYCLVLQYGQTCQFSLSALPHSMHGLRSFFMQYGQIRKSFSTGL